MERNYEYKVLSSTGHDGPYKTDKAIVTPRKGGGGVAYLIEGTAGPLTIFEGDIYDMSWVSGAFKVIAERRFNPGGAPRTLNAFYRSWK